MNRRQIIQTPRLSLVCGEVETARAAARGDHAAFALALDAHVPPEWPPEIMADAQKPLVQLIESGTSSMSGLAWYVVLRDKHTLIGFVGFKGPPRDGRLDIGYAILDAHQGRGYAAEAVRALTHWAFLDRRVQRIVAETYPHLTASIRVLEKCGYSLAAAATTGHDGEADVAQYEMRREQLFGS